MESLVQFDSLNPYHSVQALTANSPEELVTLIKSIRVPIRIIAITNYGSRQVAYVQGDLPQVQPKKRGPKPKGV